MALHMNGNVQAVLQTTHQFKRGIGFQQSGHIFNAQTVGTHILNLLTQIQP